MDNAPPSLGTVGLLLTATGVLAALGGLGFALWSRQAPGIFLSMVEAGLSWCF